MPKINSMKLALTTLTILITLTVAAAGIVCNRTRGRVIFTIISADVVSERVAGVSARGREQSKGGKSMVSGKYVLVAQPERELFKLGEQIMLRLSLSNYTDKEIYIIQTNPTRDNELEIKNAKGEKVPLSEKGKRLLDSPVLRRIVSRIGAGQAIQYTITVSDLYDLSAHDAYTVTVKRKILMKDKKTFVDVKSNPVKIIIQL
jgi:hypothetical protein